MSKCGLIASLLMACMLTACTVNDAEGVKDLGSYLDVQYYDVYEGEWTINKELVDTARLEVTDVLKIRLPEAYLGASCFEKEYVSSMKPFHIVYKGQPVVIPFKDQGYTNNATFNSISSAEKSYNGTTLYHHASFTVTIDGVNHRVELLSEEPGSAIYRNDSGLWTIGFTVNKFCVKNMETYEEEVRTPNKPIVLYYNATKRIR